MILLIYFLFFLVNLAALEVAIPKLHVKNLPLKNFAEVPCKSAGEKFCGREGAIANLPEKIAGERVGATTIYTSFVENAKSGKNKNDPWNHAARFALRFGRRCSRFLLVPR